MRINKWRQLPVVSVGLVGINIFLYLICLFDGGRLYRIGSLDAYKVLAEGEYGRILFSLFLHGSTEHLFNNMIILFFLGTMIERETGHLWYGSLFLLSGVGGNLLSLYSKIINNDQAVSIGASGAVFGLDGVLLAMLLFSGKRLQNVSPWRVTLMILLSLYSGFVGDHIDNAAHVGGLIIGFLAGCFMCVIKRKRKAVT